MKHLVQKMLLCGALSVLSVSTFAQKKQNAEDVPNLPLPEVIDFSTGKPIAKEELKETGKKGMQASNLDYKNQIGVNATNVLFGIADIGYERAITNNLSLEITGGITLPASAYWSGTDAFAKQSIAAQKDLRATFWQSQNKLLAESTLYATTTLGGTNDVRAIKLVPDGTGTSFGLHARYYMSQTEVFHGFYIGASARLSNVGYKIEYTGEAVKKNVTDLGALFGYNIFNKRRITASIETIVGTRIVKMDGYERVYDLTQNTQTLEPITYNYSGLFLLGSIRLGYLF